MKIGDFWTFGDSFASTSMTGIDWFTILKNNFVGKNFYNNFCDSRDVQTIMDSFYKNLCNIKKDSFVVIWLPSMARIRYPKSPTSFDTIYESSFFTNGKGEGEKIENFNISEYFSHWPYNNYPSGEPKFYLDFPFNTFDFSVLDKVNSMTYDYQSSERMGNIRENLEFGVTPIDFAKFIVANTASKENWKDIFFSLQKSCKFEILFVSWTDEYSSDIVFGKEQLTNEIGFWNTKHDEYLETSGNSGLEWDEHFSTKMNNAFANWVIKKYPKYFKEVII